MQHLSNMQTKTVSFWTRLKEISMFFQGRDEVHKTLRRLVKRLQRAQIPYAVLGGMALSAHRYRRTTDDVDILLTAEGLTEFVRFFVPKQYDLIPGRSRRFRDQKNDVTVDILVTGRYPGSGKPGPIAFPQPAQVAQIVEKIRVVNLATLVELKLAAGRYLDFGDVVGLIRFNHLDESFAERLHPSVRGDFIECLDEKRREDEYEAREEAP